MPISHISTDTIDLVVSAIVIDHDAKARNLSFRSTLPEVADYLGQQITAANALALGVDFGSPSLSPTYSWTPVLELAGGVTDAELLQIEASRRYIQGNVGNHLSRPATSALEGLEILSAQRLKDWPINIDDSGHADYATLPGLSGQWSRVQSHAVA